MTKFTVFKNLSNIWHVSFLLCTLFELGLIRYYRSFFLNSFLNWLLKLVIKNFKIWRNIQGLFSAFSLSYQFQLQVLCIHKKWVRCVEDRLNFFTCLFSQPIFATQTNPNLKIEKQYEFKTKWNWNLYR